MTTRLSHRSPVRGLSFAGFVLCVSPVFAGETPSQDWLAQGKTSGESFRATAGQVATDPFAVLSTGSLWQEKSGTLYTRQMDPALSLSCETSNTQLDANTQASSRAQSVALLIQPAQEFTFRGDFHGASTDALMPGDSTTASGAGFLAQSRLPLNSVVSVGLHLDRTATDAPSGVATRINTYNAQLEQPLGKLPLSAVFKSQLADTASSNAPSTSLPTLEQSLVWKPLATTTLQMGLRQQQYQEYPGVDHPLNEALFADWSQKMLDNVSWHSYAEVLNSKGLNDQAPASPLASGANGTAQATTPGANASLTSSMPVSLEDQTITFSTGPSVQLQKDISASLEYSNRWDKNPAEGSLGQEQRVSVSVKGSF